MRVHQHAGGRPSAFALTVMITLPFAALACRSGESTARPSSAVTSAPVASADAAPRRYTVMPLGDSITDGYATPGGYRIELARAAAAAGLLIDFVGSQSNGPPSLADRDHEGHNGWRIDQLDARATQWVSETRPDVVLLLIGTNDVYQDYDLAHALDRLSALIDHVLAAAPGVRVVVSSLPPLASAAMEARVVALDRGIPTMVLAKEAEGRRVSFVDLHAALGLDDLADGVHPNADGYAKMARAWLPALRASVAQ